MALQQNIPTPIKTCYRDDKTIFETKILYEMFISDKRE
jgi:hypothetical protein